MCIKWTSTINSIFDLELANHSLDSQHILAQAQGNSRKIQVVVFVPIQFFIYIYVYIYMIYSKAQQKKGATKKSTLQASKQPKKDSRKTASQNQTQPTPQHQNSQACPAVSRRIGRLQKSTKPIGFEVNTHPMGPHFNEENAWPRWPKTKHQLAVKTWLRQR